ncbi:hypothetical protein [Rubinisphaera brasiliensis]|uniref:Uncharacterized protein n=1 Tax=Rubinisphaera brasiliensis (strain ATCC 49424 / DSM 5305 / JCM 21570 / IAM 15109 / NBRC 103401 / IFAM 1448) TaxID=756272 RepID=F0SKR2_RUBBR|nr:hypothetical protein [Rubinisphaera brasiliensis]ADY58732.1 hypothetical protein Plabr_1115 [Rubinisphaera brasiliensis DSM 5305]
MELEVAGVLYRRDDSQWIDAKTNMAMPIAMQHKLNRTYLDRYAKTDFERWGRDDLNGFLGFVRSLGGTDIDLIRLGLDFLVKTERDADPFESPLHLMGYIVGKEGMPTAERRQILADAFLGEIPNAGPAEYMARWGMPGTKQRFYAIAGHIRRCRDELVRPACDYSVADDDWTKDLNWFAAKFRS